MAAKLQWAVDRLYDVSGKNPALVGQVRTRAKGLEHDYVTHIGERRVSEPYQRKDDARQDLERQVRSLLKAAGVES